MRTRKIGIIFGTRPEAIKLAPVVYALQKHPRFTPILINTGQHQEMIQQVLKIFALNVDYSLEVMTPNQPLCDLSAKILQALSPIFAKEQLAAILTQGDTTTTLAASLAAFYHKIPVGHIEAGLRSFEKYAPFPEEINRKLVSSLCDWNFTPTEEASANLRSEGFAATEIYQVGNTVVDALYHILNTTKPTIQPILEKQSANCKVILMTAHRRENIGEGFENICKALRAIVDEHENIQIVYPVHLNPNIRIPAQKYLKGHPKIHLLEPLNYIDFVHLLQKSHFVMTDSGGVQEEAPILGKPVLVLREVTERPEGIRAGVAKLVSTDTDRIVTEARRLLNEEGYYQQMSQARSLYGDGHAAVRIIDVISSKIP